MEIHELICPRRQSGLRKLSFTPRVDMFLLSSSLAPETKQTAHRKKLRGSLRFAGMFRNLSHFFSCCMFSCHPYVLFSIKSGFHETFIIAITVIPARPTVPFLFMSQHLRPQRLHPPGGAGVGKTKLIVNNTDGAAAATMRSKTSQDVNIHPRPRVREDEGLGLLYRDISALGAESPT